MPVFTLGLGGHYGTSTCCNVSSARNAIHIDPCASITDTDSPQNIGASLSTDRQSICVAYSDTPEMLSFTLAGHAVENSPRPSACPNTDIELGMGASALGIAKD